MQLCKLLLFSFFMLYVSSARSQTQVPVSKFQRVIGGALSDAIHDIKLTQDSGYILVGSTESFGGSFPGDRDMYVVKTDAKGNVKWTKTFGTNASEEAMSVENMDNGDYLIVGNSVDSLSGNSSTSVWHISGTGSLFWQKQYSIFPVSYGNVIKATGMGTYIICGKSFNTTNNDNEAYMMAIDENGDVLWCKGYNGATGYDDGLRAVTPAPDGGYLLTGDSYSTATHDYNVLAIKTDSSGNAQWIKTYASTNNSRGYGAYRLGNGYIIGGQMVGVGSQADMLMMKIDDAGGLVWEKTYGGSMIDFIHSFVQQDNTFVLVGESQSFSVDNSFDAYVVRTDTTGNVLSSLLYGDTSQYEAAICAVPGPYHTLGIGGTVNGWGYGLEDFYFIKTRQDTSSCYNQQANTTVTSVSVNTSSYTGTDTLSATYVDLIPLVQSGFNDTTICFSVDTITNDTTTNVTSLSAKGEFTLFPNPSAGEFTVHMQGSTEEYDIKVFNSLGADVTSQFAIAGKGQNISFKAYKHVPGLYMLALRSKQGAQRTLRVLMQ